MFNCLCLCFRHVNDFCWGGTEPFNKNFNSTPLESGTGNVGTGNVVQGTGNVKILKYPGLDIIQNNKYDVSLNQTKFVDGIKEI